MEIFGGFMVMFSIIGFFLTVIWFVLPFVIIAIKGKVDRAELQMERIEHRLASIEERITNLKISPPVTPPLSFSEASSDDQVVTGGPSSGGD